MESARTRGSGPRASLEKEIVRHGVMQTPALVIDGEVKASGRIPSSAEIVTWITAAAATVGDRR